MTDESEDFFGPASATFGDRFAAAREAAGMSQTEFARRLGVNKSTVREWEDDLKEPRANRLSMMAGLLNVSMTWLITGTGDGIDAPSDEAVLPATVQSILSEIRVMRADMLSQAERLGRLEKNLRAALYEDDFLDGTA